MLDDLLLETFINTFYGYGNYQGDYWFIGMEEGGEWSEEHIKNRLNTWSNRGQHELEDAAKCHEAIEPNNLFKKGARLQNTWKGLIHILLAATGQDLNKENVRNYQINELGRNGKNTCLLELFPLPSPSITDWFYKDYSLLPYLSTRQNYIDYCVEFRINHLKNTISKFNPKVVIFYGVKYQEYWLRIANINFSIIEEGQYSYQIGNNDKTLFAVVKHPVSRGLSNEYFDVLGKIIASRLK